MDLMQLLTPKQREICNDLVFTSLNAKEIAMKHNRHNDTIKKHTEQIYLKLGVHSRLELIVKVRGNG